MSGGAASGTQGETHAESGSAARGERIAKVIARAGICSRRDAERLIAEGRVALNGRTLTTPAVTVGPHDRVAVDGNPLATRERTRLWLFNKPKGLVTTNRDPEGRPTVFSALPPDMPRVLSVGRLDINTEGLLLLTNDGGLARVLELPSTGWLRRYRVRAHGRIDQPALDALKRGVTIDGMIYGAVEAEIDRVQGSNVWLIVGLREGKNREVKRVLEHLGLGVNRLIRISYGPFQLGDLEEGEVREVRGRVLRDQLGEKLAQAAGADFDAPIRQPEPKAAEQGPRRGKKRAGRSDDKAPASGRLGQRQGGKRLRADAEPRDGPRPGRGARRPEAEKPRADRAGRRDESERQAKAPRGRRFEEPSKPGGKPQRSRRDDSTPPPAKPPRRPAPAKPRRRPDADRRRPL